MIKNNKQHGVGGSHFGAFGRYLMLRAPEGDGAGAGTAGGESTATTATPAASANTGDPATAPGAATSEKMLPQSQVNTLIANAKREAKEAARRELEQLQQQQAPAPEKKKDEAKPPTSISAADVQQIIARERAIERAATGLTASRAARMEEACRAANPSDVAAWCKSYREDMGFDVTPAQPAAPAAPTTTAPAEPAKPPASAPRAPTDPVSPVTHQGMVDLFALTPQQIDQLGPTGMRQHFENALSVGRQQMGVPTRPKVPARK